MRRAVCRSNVPPIGAFVIYVSSHRRVAQEGGEKKTSTTAESPYTPRIIVTRRSLDMEDSRLGRRCDLIRERGKSVIALHKNAIKVISSYLIVILENAHIMRRPIASRSGFLCSNMALSARMARGDRSQPIRVRN